MTSRFATPAEAVAELPAIDLLPLRESPAAPLEETRAGLAPARSPASAREAVEAVVSLVERISDRAPHAVNLRFSVGDTPLAVRVELRGEEIHTAFFSESAELCALLAHEWRTLSGGAPERLLRFEAPLFASTGGTSTGFSASSDGTFGRHQQALAQRFGGDNDWFLRTREVFSAELDDSEAEPPANWFSPAPSSRHLHAHA